MCPSLRDDLRALIWEFTEILPHISTRGVLHIYYQDWRLLIEDDLLPAQLSGKMLDILASNYTSPYCKDHYPYRVYNLATRNRGQGVNSIREIIRRKYGLSVHENTIRNWLKKIHQVHSANLDWLKKWYKNNAARIRARTSFDKKALPYMLYRLLKQYGPHDEKIEKIISFINTN
jgi:hypothetical protein